MNSQLAKIAALAAVSEALVENTLNDLEQSKHRRGSSQQSTSNETRKMKNKRKAARKMRKRNHK